MASRERQAENLIKGAGWKFGRFTGRAHVLWLCPCGSHTMTTSRSPSAEFLDKVLGILRRCPRTVKL